AVLKKRYPNLVVGFSTHEEPTNTENVQMAYARGARMYEKHVGVETDKIKLNAYSTNPKQTEEWVKALLRAKAAMGTEDKVLDPKEKEDLESLMRGVFAKRPLRKG